MKITNTIKITKLLAILFISVFTFTACSDDDDDHDHDSEEELITTVKYTLTNGSDVVTLTYSDPDGEGGNDGTYSPSEPSLTANTTYTGVVQLLNETESPAEDITEEVKDEADEHEFFYTSSGLTITKTDVDGNGFPLGVETSLITAGAGSGALTIVLKHEPTKPNDGSSSSAGGSTDVEVTFNVTIN